MKIETRHAIVTVEHAHGSADPDAPIVDLEIDLLGVGFARASLTLEQADALQRDLAARVKHERSKRP